MKFMKEFFKISMSSTLMILINGIKYQVRKYLPTTQAQGGGIQLWCLKTLCIYLEAKSPSNEKSLLCYTSTVSTN